MLNQHRLGIAFELAFRFVPGSKTKWCAACAGYAPGITLQTAAALENTDTIDIFRRVERGSVHHFATTDGDLLICLGSLLDTNPNAPANDSGNRS